MTTDFCGCPVTLGRGADREAALAAWNDTIRGFLSHAAATPERLERTISLAPDFALAYACRGLFCLLLGRRELVDAARSCCATAEGLAADIGPRERLYLRALRAWLDGQPSGAAWLIEDALALFPGDALAMKLGQSIRFVLGDAGGMRRSLERIAPAWDEDHPARGYLDGCYAFALEEAGEYADAERFGCRALERAPDDAWGLHAVAHVHDMTGDSARGLAWLTPRREAWAHCNNFRYHVWWHVALMHLDQGDTAEVLRLYDETIRADRTDDYRDISNAASLLMRLEIEGVAVGRRWEELAEIAQTRIEDGCLAFADLHYLLALVGGARHDATRDLIARIHANAQRRETEIDRTMRRPGLDAASGLEAFGEGRFADAFAHLSTARPVMQTIGGSHAQRDVFERLTIEAGLRAGRLDETSAILDARTSRRGGHLDRFARERRETIAQARKDAAGLCDTSLAVAS